MRPFVKPGDQIAALDKGEGGKSCPKPAPGGALLPSPPPSGSFSAKAEREPPVLCMVPPTSVGLKQPKRFPGLLPRATKSPEITEVSSQPKRQQPSASANTFVLARKD